MPLCRSAVFGARFFVEKNLWVWFNGLDQFRHIYRLQYFSIRLRSWQVLRSAVSLGAVDTWTVNTALVCSIRQHSRQRRLFEKVDCHAHLEEGSGVIAEPLSKMCALLSAVQCEFPVRISVVYDNKWSTDCDIPMYVWRRCMNSISTPCLKKVCRFYFRDNFGKRGPIFIIFHCCRILSRECHWSMDASIVQAFCAKCLSS